MNGIIINNNTVTIPYHFTSRLDPYYKFMKHATVLIFNDRENDTYRYRYDHPIKLVSTIKVLKLGRLPRYPVILTPCVHTLELLCGSEHSIILMPNITTLKLDCYNCPIILTPNIIILFLGFIFNHPIVLTKNILHLTFGSRFIYSFILNKKLNVLISQIRCSENTFVLSKYLVSLERYSEQLQPLVLNKNMQKLTLNEYTRSLVLSKNILIFIVNEKFDGQLVLNKHITHLNLRYLSFNKPIILTKNIIYFGISCRTVSNCDLVQTTILTSGIKTFFFKQFNGSMRDVITLDVLRIGKAFGDNLSNTVCKIVCNTLEILDNVPNSVKCFE